MLTAPISITLWQILCVVFVAGGFVVRISFIASEQKVIKKDQSGLVTKETFEKSTSDCQMATGRTLDTLRGDVKELKNDVKKMCTFIGRVEEHMKQQNQKSNSLL